MITNGFFSIWLRPCNRSVAQLPLRTLSSYGSKKNLLTDEEGVHQTMRLSKSWKQKPLFRRQGDVRFKTGMEAANLLIREARRRDDEQLDYIDCVTSTVSNPLDETVIIDRSFS